MKNIPKKIYLQIGDDFGSYDDFAEARKDLYEITWCEDKINDNDIEYVLSSAVSGAKH